MFREGVTVRVRYGSGVYSSSYACMKKNPNRFRQTKGYRKVSQEEGVMEGV